MLATLIAPLFFQVFMSIGMNRVWSLYLMLQISSNIAFVENIMIPGSVNLIMETIYNMSNFKIFETDFVINLKSKYKLYHPNMHHYTLGNGIIITGSIVLVLVIISVAILRKNSQKNFDKVKETLRRKIFWSPILRS